MAAYCPAVSHAEELREQVQVRKARVHQLREFSDRASQRSASLQANAERAYVSSKAHRAYPSAACKRQNARQ
jgi:hypothetical protein